MDYDPVKDRLGALFSRWPWLQRLFFTALGAVFLRNWYVRRALREVMAVRRNDDRVRVLDAGTGFGQYAYWIARHFPNAEVVAVDVKELYLNRTRAFIASQGLSERVTFGVDDLTDLKQPGPFDVILSVDVMEHIEDDRAVFANFRRVLADGGVVIVNTPSDQGGSDVGSSDGESFIGEHVRDGYSVDELAEKLSAAGLDVFETSYTYGRWGSLAWRLLVKYPIKMLNRSFVFAALLPFYYLPVFPVGMLLNAMDVSRENERGTGLIVKAR
jgi:2-polyprenyl-3-methyl-5-hydroxy-6-metoxy-1,4-benzoquinol methylase